MKASMHAADREAPSDLPTPFLLERFMAKYEFHAAYPLCLSDCQPLSLKDVLSMADPACMQMWLALSLGYTDSDGLLELRQEIASLYEAVSSQEVLVMVPQEAIQIASRALLQKGDHVVCVAPAYQSLHENATALGCSVSFWDIEADSDGRQFFNVEALRRLMRPKTKAVFVNFPHNPSGAVASPRQWEDIVSCCSDFDAYLFSDEMYRMLELPPTRTLRSAVDTYEKSISLGGMSKSLSMAGIRLGWLVTKDKTLYGRLQLLHDYYSICHAAPSEVLALIGLRNRHAIVAQNIDIIHNNIKLAEDFFNRHRNLFEFHAPQGSSTAFPRLITGEAVDKFCDRVVKESGVFLLPAQVYGHQKSAEEGRFRIGLGRRDFEKGIEALDSYLRQAQAGHTQSQ